MAWDNSLVSNERMKDLICFKFCSLRSRVRVMVALPTNTTFASLKGLNAFSYKTSVLSYSRPKSKLFGNPEYFPSELEIVDLRSWKESWMLIYHGRGCYVGLNILFFHFFILDLVQQSSNEMEKTAKKILFHHAAHCSFIFCREYSRIRSESLSPGYSVFSALLRFQTAFFCSSARNASAGSWERSRHHNNLLLRTRPNSRFVGELISRSVSCSLFHRKRTAAHLRKHWWQRSLG